MAYRVGIDFIYYDPIRGTPKSTMRRYGHRGNGGLSNEGCRLKNGDIPLEEAEADT